MENYAMSGRAEKILIVDSDKEILYSLTRILQLEGYLVQTVPNGVEAIVKARNESFDVFLIDIILPDMEGTEVLTQIQSINPNAIKIMITGCPSIDNASKSTNMGANSYQIKPLKIDILLRDLKEKLKDQHQQNTVTGRKKEDWVKLRISKIQLNEYSKFAEETANLFGTFGLSKTQAKVYMALNALGVATASEIAALSRIRREEVYRMMPELENRGIISSRLEAPRKFAATEPKSALNILVKVKAEAMEREMSTLYQMKDELISRLLNTSFGIYEESSVEALSRQDNVDMRLTQMSKKAKNHILLVGSLDEMKKIINESAETGANQIRMRTIVDVGEIIDHADESGDASALRHFLLITCRGNCKVELRQVDKRTFNLVIVDGKEAIWGESKSEMERKFFWTNDPVQVGILKRAFENLWQEAVPCEPCLNEARVSTLA
jgi:DNA-binding response OmpR family regulator